MTKDITLVFEPFATIIASPTIHYTGLTQYSEWLHDMLGEPALELPETILPHDGYDVEWNDESTLPRPTPLSGAELLAEFAGRHCYHSWNSLGKSGKKTNKAYLHNVLHNPEIPPHKSIAYHGMISMCLGDISRNLLQELIRHYVGCARDEMGTPSVESTRFTEHPGRFILPPAIIGNEEEAAAFQTTCQQSYNQYLAFMQRHKYHEKKGLAKKRVAETAREYLPGAASTSLIWSMNAESWAKMIVERADQSANQEFTRLAILLSKKLVAHSPNLFGPAVHDIAKQLFVPAQLE